MPEKNRGIGSEGLEQGGPNLGNDYSRKDLGVGNAGDALTTPNTKGMSREDDDRDTLDMDKESSRNLSGETSEDADTDDVDLDDDDLDDDDLDDDEDDEDDEDEDDELDKGL